MRSDIPQPTPLVGAVVDEARRELHRSGARGTRALSDHIRAASHRLGISLTPIEADAALSILESEYLPFGILQPLIDDPTVSDIIVTDFGRIAVQRGRTCQPTRLSFPSSQAYEAYVERLLLRGGVSYSTKQPIVDWMLGSDIRLHAVHSSVCGSGPYLTIRINRFSNVHAADLVKAETAPSELLTYLTTLVRHGRTVLVVGEVGTGKTTLARALANAIPHHEAILVIEDSPEIHLEHPHTRYMRTREPNLEGEGALAPHLCIRAGMRMAMNRIVFGEIRDSAAAESFIDVCASGHPGVSTIHGRSSCDAIARLELFLMRAHPGVQRETVQQQIALAVDCVVHVGWCTSTRRRRVMDVREIVGCADNTIRQRLMWEYDRGGGVPRWRVGARESSFGSSITAEAQLSSLGSFVTSSSTLFREGQIQ